MGWVLYVEYPEFTLERFAEDEEDDLYGVELTEDEKGLFHDWIAARHPNIDFNDSGSDRELWGEVHGHYKEGESTHDLMMRVCINNPAWIRLRNEWEILFTGFHAFMGHIFELREKEAEEWHGEIEDDAVEYASDSSTSIRDLVRCKYVVVVEDDQDRKWVIGCRDEKQIARIYMDCMLEENGHEWVDGVHHFQSGKPFKHDVKRSVTVSVNDEQFTYNDNRR